MPARRQPAAGVRRAVRRDAIENREKILTVAAELIAQEGLNVPLADIARASGVGIGTFYRGFPDRTALVHALELRAYGLLIALLERIEESGQTGAAAVDTYLHESLALGDQLVLPFRGAPPFLDKAAVTARATIDAALQRFLAGGHADGTITTDVTTTDIIVCGAMATQLLPRGPRWTSLARRHVGIFIRGLKPDADPPLTDPPATPGDVEKMFSAV